MSRELNIVSLSTSSLDVNLMVSQTLKYSDHQMTPQLDHDIVLQPCLTRMSLSTPPSRMVSGSSSSCIVAPFVISTSLSVAASAIASVFETNYSYCLNMKDRIDRDKIFDILCLRHSDSRSMTAERWVDDDVN